MLNFNSRTGGLTSPIASITNQAYHNKTTMSPKIDSTVMPKSNFFGGTFVSQSAQNNMMQTKVNDQKLRVILSNRKEPGNSARISGPTSPSASSMIGLTRNPIINFNPKQQNMTMDNRNSRPADRYKWGAVEPTPV